MSDCIVNPAVKYKVGMPFDSFAELKSWSEEMDNCRLAVNDLISDRNALIRVSQKLSKYVKFVSICWNWVWRKLIKNSRLLQTLIYYIYDGYFFKWFRWTTFVRQLFAISVMSTQERSSMPPFRSSWLQGFSSTAAWKSRYSRSFVFIDFE